MTTFQRIIKYCAVAFALFLIVTIIGGICSGVGLAFGILSNNKDVIGETRTYAVNNTVDRLDMEIGAAALEIVNGDHFIVQSNHKYLTVTEENGTLNISEKKHTFGVSTKEISVILTVPEGFVFDEVSMETGAGKVSIDTLSAKTLTMDLGAGETTIGTLNAQTRSKINTGAGKLTIQGGELHDLSMDHGVGKLELKGLLTGDCDVEFGIGDADLTLLGNREDYQIHMEKGLGNATVDGTAMGDDSIYGHGENRIEVDGGIGSVQIQFENN